MPDLENVEWEACVLEPAHDAEAERFLRGTYGIIVPPGMRYFACSMWLTRTCAALGIGQVPLMHTSDEMSELISLVVSQDNSCRYCFTATRSVMRILGYPAARIRELEDDLGLDLEPRQRLALQFARRISRGVPLVGAADAQPLIDAGYAPDAVKEIAFIAAVNVFFNRVSTLPALPPEDVDIADRWYVRVLRPILARKFTPRRTAIRSELTPPQRSGPFAELVNALDGLPGAPRLRAVLDEAWGNTSLTRRTKALVFAVVARGIGCGLSEREACRLLEAEGMPSATIEHVLAHLSGPTLDPLDAAAAAVARESIWYRPSHIQRQLRAVRSLFTDAQFVELIGMTGLANMICRLGVTTQIGATH